MNTHFRRLFVVAAVSSIACTNETEPAADTNTTAREESFQTPTLSPRPNVERERHDIYRFPQQSLRVVRDNGEVGLGIATLSLHLMRGECVLPGYSDGHSTLEWQLGVTFDDGLVVGLTYQATPADPSVSGSWTATVTTNPLDHNDRVMGMFEYPKTDSRQIREGTLEFQIDRGRVYGRFETGEEIGSFEFFGTTGVQCLICSFSNHEYVSDEPFESEFCQPFARFSRFATVP